MKRNNTCKRRHGVAMVEFALISTLLIGLTMAMIQYGVIYNTTISLTNASREAARFAAVHAHKEKSDADIKKHIETTMPPNVKYSDLTVTITPPDTNMAARKRGDTISVTITYPMNKKAFLPSKFLGMTIFRSDYTTTGKMMIEG